MAIRPGRAPAPLVAAAVLLCSAGPARPQQQVPRFQEQVVVSRLLMDARVLDGRGEPMTGLVAGDFRATIDGKPARVESATWIGSTPDGQRRLEATELPWAAPEPPGRLIVFLFQKDLEPSRIVGLMRMLIQAQDLLGTFGPDDRVAVLSFDYHLKLWLDFTNDRDRIRTVLAHDILFAKAPADIPPGPFPSLARHLTQAQARRAYSVEEALLLLGEALTSLPGAKSLVLVGHGFGRLSGSSILFEPEYGRARLMLQRARASVFCLDVTDADAHTLEAGLEMVAEDTGGFFARTHLFPGQAVARLVGALSGYYVLFIEVPEGLDRRVHAIEIGLADREGLVLARHHFGA
jgi:VWFA-related protein